MTEKEKDIIYKLYVKEGRSITYIAKLLDLKRVIVKTLILQEKWEQGGRYILKPSTEKWIKENKNKIISLIYQGFSDYAISVELGCTYEMIHNSCMRGCSEIKEARLRYAASQEETILRSDEYPGEEWRDVLGYSGYKISSYGRLISYYNDIPKIIKPTQDLAGRYNFIIKTEGQPPKTFKRARLVAHAFCQNDNPQIKKTVDHINGDFTDDRASNLEWVSQSENNKRAYKKGRVKNRNHNSHNRKEIFLVDNKYTFKTISALARFIGKSETQTRRIIGGEVRHPAHDIKIIPKM